MWADRYTVYYAKEKHYAVRWLGHGRPEGEAQYRTFDDLSEAERFYNDMVKQQGPYPTLRVELYFSQSKWVMYHANQNEFGEPVTTPIGDDSATWFGNPADHLM